MPRAHIRRPSDTATVHTLLALLAALVAAGYLIPADRPAFALTGFAAATATTALHLTRRTTREAHAAMEGGDTVDAPEPADETDALWAQEQAAIAELDTHEAARGNMRVACRDCDGDMYVPTGTPPPYQRGEHHPICYANR